MIRKMKRNTDKIKASYHFFVKMQDEKKSLTKEDIAVATGWSDSTIRTYVSKKWNSFLLRSGRTFTVNNVKVFSEDEYVRMMSQVNRYNSDPYRPNLPESVEEMVLKAKEAAILAVDIYNRPATSFRSQGYIVMMIIAWTALFHAIFDQQMMDYFCKEKDGTVKMIDGDKKAWELKTCINKCGSIIDGATKENLKLFIMLRNKIEHRHVPEFDLEIFGECQSLLLNFEELLTQKFGFYYALNSTLSFPLQVTSVRNLAQIKAIKKVQSKHYEELKQYIDAYRANLPDGIYGDNRFSFRVFLIPQIGNHPTSADKAIEFIKYDPKNKEEFDELKKQIAFIKEKRIPVANQGKFRPSMVCVLVENQLNKKFSVFNHTQAWKYYKVRKSNYQPDGCTIEFCQYDEAHRDYVYTQAWVDFLIKKLSNDGEYQKVIAYKEPKFVR